MQLRADVIQALQDDPRIESSELGVACTVSAGWVTLECAVDQAVRKLPSVPGVANQLAFRTSASPHDDHQPSAMPA